MDRLRKRTKKEPPQNTKKPGKNPVIDVQNSKKTTSVPSYTVENSSRNQKKELANEHLIVVDPEITHNQPETFQATLKKPQSNPITQRGKNIKTRPVRSGALCEPPENKKSKLVNEDDILEPSYISNYQPQTSKKPGKNSVIEVQSSIKTTSVPTSTVEESPGNQKNELANEHLIVVDSEILHNQPEKLQVTLKKPQSNAITQGGKNIKTKPVRSGPLCKPPANKRRKLVNEDDILERSDISNYQPQTSNKPGKEPDTNAPKNIKTKPLVNLTLDGSPSKKEKKISNEHDIIVEPKILDYQLQTPKKPGKKILIKSQKNIKKEPGRIFTEDDRTEKRKKKVSIDHVVIVDVEKSESHIEEKKKPVKKILIKSQKNIKKEPGTIFTEDNRTEKRKKKVSSDHVVMLDAEQSESHLEEKLQLLHDDDFNDATTELTMQPLVNVEEEPASSNRVFSVDDTDDDLEQLSESSNGTKFYDTEVSQEEGDELSIESNEQSSIEIQMEDTSDDSEAEIQEQMNVLRKKLQEKRLGKIQKLKDCTKAQASKTAIFSQSHLSNHSIQELNPRDSKRKFTNKTAFFNDGDFETIGETSHSNSIKDNCSNTHSSANFIQDVPKKTYSRSSIFQQEQTEHEAQEYLISNLNDNCGSNWIVTGEVVSHGELNVYSGGKYFKFVLQNNTAKIQCTGFNESAKDAESVIKLHHVYSIAGGKVQISHPDYNKTKHGYEILLERFTKIEEKPGIKFDIVAEPFLTVSQCLETPVGEVLNIKGLITKVYDVKPVTSTRKGQDYQKRVIVVRDTEGNEIDVDLWRNDVDKITEKHLNKRLILLNGVLTEFQSRKSVSATGGRLQVT